jgi:hypothetical protein
MEQTPEAIPEIRSSDQRRGAENAETRKAANIVKVGTRCCTSGGAAAPPCQNNCAIPENSAFCALTPLRLCVETTCPSTAFICFNPCPSVVEKCSKKVKKNVDASLAFWDICVTHGNNRTTTQHKMRTKTLLLSAAALLAAGIVSSQAQPVYSQNIVGYASVATPNSGTYYLMTVPFVVGTSNGANEVFGSTLPSGTTLLTWDPATQSYASYIYDTSNPSALPAPVPVWYYGDDATPAIIPKLPVGAGFFLVPNGPVTNTFAGTVAVNVGTSNKMTLPNSGTYYLISSVVPYAGAVTNGNDSGGGANLNNLPSGTTVLLWDAATQSYASYIYDTSNPSALPAPVPVWYYGDDATPAPVPTLSVGDGFFIVPNGAYVWTTGL